MLSFLFPRLTTAAREGAALFDAATARAREPHWYREGQVPDTLDGRFRMLSTIAALILVKLEREGEAGNRLSVALTERFIEVMESEHRELGLGDPKLGRTVRTLVGSLASRVELWRSDAAKADWNDAVRRSVYAGDAAASAVEHTARSLSALWTDLEDAEFDALAEGRIR